MTTHVCNVCKKTFHTDVFGRRESDFIKNTEYCDLTCNLAAIDIDEGRSIRWAVLNGSVESAARRVLDVFSMDEFKRSLADVTNMTEANYGQIP